MSVFLIAMTVLVLITSSIILATIFSRASSGNKSSKLGTSFYFTCFLFICIFPTVAGMVAVEYVFYDKITKEVDLTNVTVKGKSTFNTQVRIFYENGWVKKLELIPNTTRKEKNGQ